MPKTNTDLVKLSKQFVSQLEDIVDECVKREQRHKKDIHDIERQNTHLLKKLESLQGPEIKDSEIYLVEKLETLEEVNRGLETQLSELLKTTYDRIKPLILEVDTLKKENGQLRTLLNDANIEITKDI